MMKQLMDKCDKNAQFIIENRKSKNLYYGKLKDLIDLLIIKTTLIN